MRLGVVGVFLALLLGAIPSTAFLAQKVMVTHTGQEILRSLNGEHWRESSTPFSHSRIHQLVIDQQNSARVWAATQQGLFVSHDSGASWQRQLVGAGRQGAALAVAVTGQRWLVGTLEGLWLSQDNGKHWQRVAGGFPQEALPLTIQPALNHPSVIFVGTERHGVFRTEDGGAHWRAINQGLPKAVGAAPVTPVKSLLAHPLDGRIAYAATEVNGIYKTTDGGAHWRAINEGLPGLAPYRTYHPLLTIDAENPETVYAVIGYPVHSHLVENKVYRSRDGGDRWEAIWELPPNVMVTSLILNPNWRDELLIGYEGGVVHVDTSSPALWPRKQATALNVAAQALDMDIGEITVLQDVDGTLAHLFDLNGQTLAFTAMRNRYQSSVQPLSFETDLGMPLTLRNDDAAPVDLPFSFPYFGTAYTRINVGSNGNITVGTYRDRFPRGTEATFSARARIAPLWDDYDPTQAPDDGGVFVRVDADRVVVTWSRLPEVFQTNSNTFQVVILSDGTIRMNYIDVNNPAGGLIGLSPGDADSVLAAQFKEESGRLYPARPLAEIFDGTFNMEAIGQRFYASHPDDFDMLVMWGASSLPDPTGSGGLAFAFHRPVRNDIQGIGRAIGEFFPGPSGFGSAGWLQGVLNMNSLRLYPADPHQNVPGFPTFSGVDTLGHESGHRWLVYAEFRDGNQNSLDWLGRQLSHWSFYCDSDSSLLEGNDWRDNGNGTFTSIGAEEGLSTFDQYFMGLRSPDEVTDAFFIRTPTPTLICFDQFLQGRDCPPQLNVTTSGTRVNVSVDQVIAAEGPRSPAVSESPKMFRQAFIFVVPAGDPQMMSDLEKIETYRQAWEPFFHQITDGRATISTRLQDETP